MDGNQASVVQPDKAVVTKGRRRRPSRQAVLGRVRKLDRLSQEAAKKLVSTVHTEGVVYPLPKRSTLERFQKRRDMLAHLKERHGIQSVAHYNSLLLLQAYNELYPESSVT